MQGHSLFIFGLGYSTTGLARQVQRDHWTVTSTCRKPERFQAVLTQQHRIVQFDPAAGRSLDPEGLKCLRESDYVISSIPPVAAKLYDPVLRAQHEVLCEVCSSDDCKIQALGYLSSTSVYGDWQGAWVDESYEARTATGRGLLRLEAELAWTALAEQLQIPLTIFRLGGIYGPMRSVLHNMMKQQQHGAMTQQVMMPDQTSRNNQARRGRQRYTSRCHVADVVAAIQADMRRRVLDQPTRQPGKKQQPQQPAGQGTLGVVSVSYSCPQIDFVNVVDDEPAARREVEAFARQLLSQQVNHTDSCQLQANLSKDSKIQPLLQQQDNLQQAETHEDVHVHVQQQQQVGDQQPPTRKKVAPEPMEEKRVSNDKLKNVLGVQLKAPTYREGLSMMYGGNIEPFDPKDLECLMGQASCMAQP